MTVQHFDLSQLAVGSPKPDHRGIAHIGFDDHPPQAPGHFDLPHLVLMGLEHIPVGLGYPMHPHDNMDILGFVFQGAFHHQDDQGGELLAGPGEVICMSAGTGVQHGERSAGNEEFYGAVVWLRPDVRDTAPRISVERPPTTRNVLHTVASGGGDGFRLESTCAVRLAHLDAGHPIACAVSPDRQVYVVAVHGPLRVNGVEAARGERVLVRGEDAHIVALTDGDVLVVELPVS